MDFQKGKEKQRDLQSHGVGVSHSACRPTHGGSNPVAEANVEAEKNTSLISHFGGV